MHGTKRRWAIAGTILGLGVIGLTTINLAPAGSHRQSTANLSLPSASKADGSAGARAGLSPSTGNGAADAGLSVPATTTVPSGSAAPPAPAAVVPGQPRIVKTAQVDVEVGKGGVPGVFDRIAALAATNQGFVADSSLSQADHPTGRLTIRVPVDRLDATISALAGMGKVGQQEIQGQDVTGQLVDLGARITSLQSEEAAFRTLLGRAQTTGEILQVQDQLFNVRTQLEQLQAQQASLSDQATYSTLTVTLHEPVAAGGPVPRPVHESLLERAWHRATHNTAAVASSVVLLLAWLTPALVVGAVVAPVWLIIRRRRRHSPAQAAPAG